ncbi:MAG: HAMP domain-containing histidine kinase [Proteobacteria bacterium]|nr:HAMP domain-containing histidine kinase [Pseudomonadota bacterium]MBU1714829.1 HAMP domain-containing histidine kinase [Pseudomonadota bacterium]
MNWPWSKSIARRIKWGYYILVALVAIGFVITAIYLSQVESQVRSLEKDSKLLDTVLEIRRYEKNWILYKKVGDFETNRQLCTTLGDLLNALDKVVPGGNDDTRIKADPEYIKQVLVSYADLMNAEFELLATGKKHRMLDKIREKGKLLVELAEARNISVRQSIDETIRKVKASALIFLLCAFFVALVLGKQLSRSAVRPLRQIVECTKQVAAGEKNLDCILEKNMDLDEVKTVFNAFKGMLAKLEHREKLVIKSEKLAAIGTLVAGVAHELNNPLSNAGTSAQILLEEMRESEELPRQFLLEMLEQITEQTDRARSIVRSLLEFSREKSVNPENLRVSDILHQTMDLVRGEIPSNVETRVYVDTDGVFRADKQRLQQALVNLLLNAFQAVEDVEGAKIVIRGNFDQETQKIRLEVADNGPGIPPEIKKNIFDPFYTTKDVGEGSGLGLAITREIIDKHGGDITVQSDNTSGTKFIITIPVEVEAPLEFDQ